MTPLRLLAAALLAAALLPATAAAQNASVAHDGMLVRYTGSSAADSVYVSLGNTAPPQPWLFDRNGAGALIGHGAGCTDVIGLEQNRVTCQVIGGGLTMDMNAGDDFVSGGSPNQGITVNGGPGVDTLIASSQVQNALNGDDGDDTLRASGVNRDLLNGGGGNDKLQYPNGNDVLSGGPGVDTLELSPSLANSISLDGVANDGPTGGIAFNAQADLENVVAGNQADTLVGSAAANTLTGGQGNDTLDGAGGPDTIVAGEGDDTISARDGVADALDCGVGNDSATVDALDTVSGCETVLRPDDDLDGTVAPFDCDDASPAVHPGAAETPGDGIDQDCSGADTPAPVALAAPAPPKPAPAGLPPTGRVTVSQIVAPVRNRWLVKARATKVTAFSVSGAPAGARVIVTCDGKGCPFAKRSRQVPPNGKVGFTGALDGEKLKPGAVIEVRITAVGWIGKVVRYTVRTGKLPKAQTLCLAPGAAKPAARC